MARPEICCGGCSSCLDCARPRVMHARVFGVSNTPGCDECPTYSGFEYKSTDPCLAACAWARLGITPVQYCGHLFNVIWMLEQTPSGTHRLWFRMEFNVGRVDFMKEFPADSPPDCFASKDKPHVLDVVYIGPGPVLDVCDFRNATAEVWGTENEDE